MKRRSLSSAISAQPRHEIKCGSSGMSAQETVHAAIYTRRLEAILKEYSEQEEKENRANEN
jgi:hypothetical protein